MGWLICHITHEAAFTFFLKSRRRLPFLSHASSTLQSQVPLKTAGTGWTLRPQLAKNLVVSVKQRGGFGFPYGTDVAQSYI